MKCGKKASIEQAGHTQRTPKARAIVMARNMSGKFSGKVKELVERAMHGNGDDVDYILGHLTPEATLSTTRFVDYALSLVESEEGVARIEYYLFHGTQIQRNYCSLFFNRLGEWPIVKQAYDQGLIDEIQAYAR